MSASPQEPPAVSPGSRPPKDPPPRPERATAPMDRSALEDLAQMDGDAFAREFSEAMGATRPRRNPKVGERVEGSVVRISGMDVFVDIGAKSEATIALSEFLDDRGEPNLQVGDRLSASLLSNRAGELRLSRRLSGSAAREMLDQAFASKIPVEGKVLERNAGGFTVDLGGARAFCPVSQIDRFPGEDLDRFVGMTLTFRIQELRDGEAVVSHRVIREEQIAAQAESLWATIQPGDQMEGTVRSVQSFGAFIDLDGVEGLVRRSELTWDDGVDPSTLLSLGQRVLARVLEIDRENRRLSLSLKDQMADPWGAIGTSFQVGGIYTATVRRLTEFGAFADLAPGLTGLIHIGNLSPERVRHPSDVVQPGQQVAVRILSMDLERKRLDLGVKQASEDWTPPADAPPAPKSGARPSASGSFATLGDLFKDIKLR